MKAIITSYTGPTNHRGPRIKATDSDRNTISIPVPIEEDSEQAHDHAVRTLCEKMNWTGKLVKGSLGNDRVYVWYETGKEIEIS